jgi:hypothetical protein
LSFQNSFKIVESENLEGNFADVGLRKDKCFVIYPKMFRPTVNARVVESGQNFGCGCI